MARRDDIRTTRRACIGIFLFRSSAYRCGTSDDRPRRDDAVLRHDDHAVSNVIPVAVRFLHPLRVDQPGPIADPGVLVDDHSIELDVASESETWCMAPRRRIFVRLIEVGAAEDRSANDASLLNDRPDADDGLVD